MHLCNVPMHYPVLGCTAKHKTKPYIELESDHIAHPSEMVLFTSLSQCIQSR